jgi:hypothetical protein
MPMPIIYFYYAPTARNCYIAKVLHFTYLKAGLSEAGYDEFDEILFDYLLTREIYALTRTNSHNKQYW